MDEQAKLQWKKVGSNTASGPAKALDGVPLSGSAQEVRRHCREEACEEGRHKR